MKKRFGNALALVVAVMMAVMLFAGCSGGKMEDENNPQTKVIEGTKDAAVESGSTGAAEQEPQKVIEIEIYKNAPLKPVESGDAYSKWVAGITGAAPVIPTISWNGGKDYMQKLQLAVASNKLPDLFLPWDGIEKELIEQGAVAELTPYLEKYGQDILKNTPENVWNLVRSNDPSGNGGIYFIPTVQDFALNGEMIRKDWLDNVGLGVPTTQDEYVNVLKAFKEQDANKNGDPNDEIPVSGRENGRWMDHLFYMYGVAMWEGNPEWDLYDGELTYSAVTPNMKAAITFCRDLYQQKLLDNETFLNKSADWLAKIKSDKVGSWFHIPMSWAPNIADMASANANTKPEVVLVHPVKVEGYEGFSTIKQYKRPEYMVSSSCTEEEIAAAIKLVNFEYNLDKFETLYYGAPGLDYKEENGKKVKIDLGADSHNLLTTKLAYTRAGAVKLLELGLDSEVPEFRPYVPQAINMLQTQTEGKVIAGDGMPSSVYGDYVDIRSHKLYYEYMTHIIIGDWPLEKYDEFIDKWYKSGGEEVTKNAREWYAKVNKK